MTTTLYRFFDRNDDLLYIGISERGAERWRDHRQHKPWWPEVATCTVEHFATRTEALDAERAAIIAESPKHNIVHNGPTKAARQALVQGRGESPSRNDLWEYETRRGLCRTAALQLSWEVSGDPISDDYCPETTSAWDLFCMWSESHRQAGRDLLRISWWLLSTAGDFEAAPGSWNADDYSDFAKYYSRPRHVATGIQFRPGLVPIADKLWRPGQFNKGGFIQEATGWKPYHYQEWVELEFLIDLACLTQRADVWASAS